MCLISLLHNNESNKAYEFSTKDTIESLDTNDQNLETVSELLCTQASSKAPFDYV